MLHHLREEEVEVDALGPVGDLEALEVLQRLDLARVDQVLADDQGGEVVAGPHLALVGHDPEVHAGGDRVEQAGRGRAHRHVDLPGGERRGHLARGGEALDVHRDAVLLEEALLDRDVDAGVGDRGQVAELDRLGGRGRQRERQQDGEDAGQDGGGVTARSDHRVVLRKRGGGVAGVV